MGKSLSSLQISTISKPSTQNIQNPELIKVYSLKPCTWLKALRACEEGLTSTAAMNMC